MIMFFRTKECAETHRKDAIQLLKWLNKEVLDWFYCFGGLRGKLKSKPESVPVSALVSERMKFKDNNHKCQWGFPK